VNPNNQTENRKVIKLITRTKNTLTIPSAIIKIGMDDRIKEMIKDTTQREITLLKKIEIDRLQSLLAKYKVIIAPKIE
jgi:hypothetical protein